MLFKTILMKSSNFIMLHHYLPLRRAQCHSSRFNDTLRILVILVTGESPARGRAWNRPEQDDGIDVVVARFGLNFFQF
jgi:hypothetical protein